MTEPGTTPKDRTACRHGHPWTEASTYVDRHGTRICRICHCERQKARYRAEHPPRPAKAPTYTSVHKKLSKDYGHAREYPCGHCDARAAEWAYLGGAEDERVCPRMNSPFSASELHYVPLCKKCHAIFDKALEFCRRGHEFTPENTYIKPNGNRRCRACTADRAAEARKRKKPDLVPRRRHLNTTEDQ